MIKNSGMSCLVEPSRGQVNKTLKTWVFKPQNMLILVNNKGGLLFVYFVDNTFYFCQISHKTSVVANPVNTPPTTSMGVWPSITFNRF